MDIFYVEIYIQIKAKKLNVQLHLNSWLFDCLIPAEIMVLD